MIVIVVELLYSLKRILLLGGLNHSPAIWLERGSYFIHFLSSGLGETMHARIRVICCCNTWRLSFTRRLRTYTLGGQFIAFHKSMSFLFLLGTLGALFGGSLEALRARLDVRGSLFTAQATQIRVGLLFYRVVFK